MSHDLDALTASLTASGHADDAVAAGMIDSLIRDGTVVSKINDAPAAPEVVATRYRDELHRTESELREALAEVARLEAGLDLQKRIAEAALSKLSDIAALRRATNLFGPMGEGATLSGAIDAVLARK